jgi:hypothetical protein
MEEELDKVPTPPRGARLLRLGEHVEANDFHWDQHMSQWRPVLTVQRRIVVKPDQFGWFCRRVTA